MNVTAIAAVSQNWVIGHKGRLPWHLPDDLKRFRQLTKGHTVLMGRRTFDSIGHPLPHRRNIVLTSRHDLVSSPPLLYVVHSIYEAFQLASVVPSNTLFVIGGEIIYRETLPFVNTVLLTLVYGNHPFNGFTGDVYFPRLNFNYWQEVDRLFHPSNSRHDYAFAHITYHRYAPC